MIGISHCEESSSHCGFLDLHFSSFSICPFILLFHYYTSDELKSRITGYCQFQKCLLSLFRSVPNVFSRWNVSTAERPVLYFLLPCWYSCTLQFSIVMPKYATPEEDVYFDKSLKALIEVDIFFSRHLLWSRHLLQVSLNHLKHFLLQVESSHTLVRPFICAFFFKDLFCLYWTEKVKTEEDMRQRAAGWIRSRPRSAMRHVHPTELNWCPA